MTSHVSSNYSYMLTLGAHVRRAGRTMVHFAGYRTLLAAGYVRQY